MIDMARSFVCESDVTKGIGGRKEGGRRPLSVRAVLFCNGARMTDPSKPDLWNLF